MALIDDFVEELLFQSVYALGNGAQMPIQRSAVVAIVAKTRPGFKRAMSKALNPADRRALEQEWQKSAYFILSCCVRIGQVAAYKANAAGHFSITETDLMDAYHLVRAPFTAALPGDYCPN